MINNLDEINYNLLKNAIQTSNVRQKVISQNIANVNTSGYKAWKVVLDNKINELQNNSLHLTRTNDRHIDNTENSNGTSNYSIEKDDSTSMRTDGNNVDIDNEMSNLAANSILYYALINQLNSKIDMRRSVLK